MNLADFACFACFLNSFQALSFVFMFPLFVIVFLTFAYFRASFYLYTLFFQLFLIYLNIPLVFFAFCLIVNLIFLIKPLRMSLVTKNIMRVLYAKKVLPTISETEKIAIEAGNTWLDSQFFNGKLDFKDIYKQEYPSLSKEEKDFLHKEVEELCGMVDDWKVFENKDLPPHVWSFLKEKRFFGFIIPREYGGLNFSPLAQSTIVAKLATRSQVLAITTMVPNSLGPAELLIKYGTQQQKDYYLPRLADGREIPCFGLTEPLAGSDANSIRSRGVVLKDENGNLKIRLNFEKRYITLGGIATIIGLAFKLEDPDNLLPEGIKTGITCILLDPDTKGIKRGRRHMPLYVPFINSPLWGEDVEVSIENVIGGLKGCGQGWKMLMECLAVGRGISLPAVSAGGTHLATRYISAYSELRNQFGLPIAKFEGVEEVLAEIYGLNYSLDAMRKFVAGAVKNGYKPSVINSIAKYHATEIYRKVINHSMDIAAGSAICVGPKNLLAHAYMGAPIGITVEGANIMTRTLMQFGQGVIRSHPYVYNEVEALLKNDLKAFDANFWSHVSHFTTNRVRMLLLAITRGNLICTSSKDSLVCEIERKLNWSAATFATLSDLALLVYGGDLKRKEKLTGRLADVMSYMFIVTCALRRYLAEGSVNPVFLEWTYRYYFSKMDQSLAEIYQNFGGNILIRMGCKISGFFSRMNKFVCKPNDKLTHLLVKAVHDNDGLRDHLTECTYIPENKDDQLSMLEIGFALHKRVYEIHQKIKFYEKKNKTKINEGRALQEGVITEAELALLQDFRNISRTVVAVDHFELKA